MAQKYRSIYWRSATLDKWGYVYNNHSGTASEVNVLYANVRERQNQV